LCSTSVAILWGVHRVVGNPYLTGLRQGCPSSRHNRLIRSLKIHGADERLAYEAPLWTCCRAAYLIPGRVRIASVALGVKNGNPFRSFLMGIPIERWVPTHKHHGISEGVSVKSSPPASSSDFLTALMPRFPCAECSPQGYDLLFFRFAQDVAHTNEGYCLALESTSPSLTLVGRFSGDLHWPVLGDP
jgi:hypothetical protein